MGTVQQRVYEGDMEIVERFRVGKEPTVSVLHRLIIAGADKIEEARRN